MTDAQEGRFQKLNIDQLHLRKVLPRLTLRRVVKRRPRDRPQCALLTNRQVRMIALNHPAPHFPPKGLSFLSKKELATASSPILACRSLTGSSSMTGYRVQTHRTRHPAAPVSIDCSSSPLGVCIRTPAGNRGTPDLLASSDAVSSPFNASSATFALNSRACCFRFDIFDPLQGEDQQAAN